MRGKRIPLAIGLIAAVVLAVLLWPKSDLPFDFLKGFRHTRIVKQNDFENHVYQADGDFDVFCITAAKELAAKGWRKIERYQREERWEDGRYTGTLIIYEAVVDIKEDPARGIMGFVDRKPGKLSVELSFRNESIWRRLLRKLGI